MVTTKSAVVATDNGLLLALSEGVVRRLLDQLTVMFTGSGRCTAAQLIELARTTPHTLREQGRDTSKSEFGCGKHVTVFAPRAVQMIIHMAFQRLRTRCMREFGLLSQKTHLQSV